MKNIQILVTLKAQVETADFMMEDLATCIDVEDVDLDELISEKDEDVLALLKQFRMYCKRTKGYDNKYNMKTAVIIKCSLVPH